MLLASLFLVNVITDVLELSMHVYALFLARLMTWEYCFVTKGGCLQSDNKTEQTFHLT